MTTYHAQPYDMDASGFYFEDADSYLKQINGVQNSFGEKVEEFELQFIDVGNI